MKTKIICCTCLLSLSRLLASAQAALPVSMPAILLQTFNKEGSDAGIHYNPAALADINGSGFSVFTENRFKMQDQKLFLASLQFPGRSANAGLTVVHESFGGWRKNGLALALGRRLGTLISTGIQINARWERAHGYPSRFNWSGDAGINIHLSNQLTAGLIVSDPFAFFLSSSSAEKLSQSFIAAGLGYDVGETFSLSAVMRSGKSGSMDIVTGFEYRHMKRFFFNGGFSGNEGIYFLGSGVAFRSSRINLAFSMHPRLGISTGFLWTVKFNKRTS